MTYTADGPTVCLPDGMPYAICYGRTIEIAEERAAHITRALNAYRPPPAARIIGVHFPNADTDLKRHRDDDARLGGHDNPNSPYEDSE